MSKRKSTSLGVLGQLVPFFAPIVAMAFGLLIGGTVGWYAHAERADLSLPSARAPQPTRSAPEVQSSRLTETRDRIAELEEAVADKEAEVADLEGRLDDPGLSAIAASALEAELTRVKQALARSHREVQQLRSAEDGLAREAKDEDTPDR